VAVLSTTPDDDPDAIVTSELVGEDLRPNDRGPLRVAIRLKDMKGRFEITDRGLFRGDVPQPLTTKMRNRILRDVADRHRATIEREALDDLPAEPAADNVWISMHIRRLWQRERPVAGGPHRPPSEFMPGARVYNAVRASARAGPVHAIALSIGGEPDEGIKLATYNSRYSAAKKIAEGAAWWGLIKRRPYRRRGSASEP
jgi:hypothetical protein